MSRDLTFFSPYTEHVGTKGAMVRLADGFAAAGDSVRFIRTYREWSARVPGNLVDTSTDIGNLAIDYLPFPWKKFALAGVSFLGLLRHLWWDSPDVVVAGLLNALAIGCQEFVASDTAVVCSVQGLPQDDGLRGLLWSRLYPRADVVVAPVDPIADLVADIAEMPREDVAVAPNPVVSESMLDRGEESPDHEWFGGGRPTVVAVGRQTKQKDFATILRAFDKVRRTHDARLVIPGKEGERTDQLARIVDERGLGDVVDFPGFVDNVYSYMAAADVFVLSSRWEGPGHVLIEAMALGTPVVATDCPVGPSDILANGDAGRLVPVGDTTAMADDIRTLLDDPSLRNRYAKRGQQAARPFHVDNAVDAYRRLVAEVTDD